VYPNQANLLKANKKQPLKNKHNQLHANMIKTLSLLCIIKKNREAIKKISSLFENNEQGQAERITTENEV